MQRSALSCLPAVLLSCVATGSTLAAPVCLERAVVLPLRDDGGYLSVPVLIDRQAASMIVDTGSEGSLVTPAGVSALRLPPDPRVHTMMQGPSGTPRLVPNVRITDLHLGTPAPGTEPLPLGAGTMAVGMLPGSPLITPPILGLLGADVLADYDLEFDVPHHRLTLWKPQPDARRCHTPNRAPPYWSGTWASVPTQLKHGRLSVAFSLDSTTGTALLDSGARSHIVSTDFAHRLGLSDERLARDPGGLSAGVDLHEREYHWHRFARFEMGGQIWNHPTLTVAPIHDSTDMLLGSDWFAKHEIWLSYTTGHLFFR